jgi:hypothetical protein
MFSGMRSFVGGLVTKLVVVTIISILSAGVYACCLVGTVAIHRRDS